MNGFLFLAILLAATSSFAGDTIKHVFIAVDNGGSKLWYVDQFEPEKSWTAKLDPGSRDMQFTADRKTVLISNSAGATEFEMATGKRTGFQITGLKGIQSARRLKDGSFLISSATCFFMCDKDGKMVKQVKLPTTSKPYIRLVRVTDQNTILYSAIKPYCIMEVDFEGKQISQTPLPKKGYKQIRLKNGNYLASGGNGACIYELTSKGKVVRTLGLKEKHPKLELWDCSGWDQLASGNIVVTCWHGHHYKGKGPHLVEYTPDNEAVWTWKEKGAKTITNVLVLR